MRVVLLLDSILVFLNTVLAKKHSTSCENDLSSSKDIVYGQNETIKEFKNVKPLNFSDENGIVKKASHSKKKSPFVYLLREFAKILRCSYFGIEKLLQLQMNELISGINKEMALNDLRLNDNISTEYSNLEKIVSKIVTCSVKDTEEAVESLIKKTSLALQKEEDAVLAKTYSDISTYINNLISLGSVAFTPIVLDTVNGLLPTVLGYVKTAQTAIPLLNTEYTRKLLYGVDKLFSLQRESLIAKILAAIEASETNVLNLVKSEEGIDSQILNEIFHKKLNFLLCEINTILINVEREIKIFLRCFNPNWKAGEELNLKKLLK
ncbi:hypothetical protein TUBRATIS_17000 [Tubulinosema ratisbonensis]|uniref:Uncharacterized protein n=1 Tax=Tubulinosema ratisbonensis TaxID=291195 RepID=A0A437ALE2_9MICR|nr:hypothetical protein TUBRATIS_17000 [Tubulinosema ratisbonensis]